MSRKHGDAGPPQPDYSVTEEPDAKVWFHQGTCTRTTIRVDASEVRLDEWWYHPQYDEEPHESTESVSLRDFLEEQRYLTLHSAFGDRGVNEIFAEVRARLGWDAAAAPVPQPGSAPFEAPATTPFTLRGLGRNLLTLLVVSAAILLIALLGARNAERTRLWWTGRVQGAFVPVPATVLAQGARFEENRGKTGDWRGQVTWMRYRYRVNGRDYTGSADFDRFGQFDEKRALDWIRARFPTGASIEAHYDPGDPSIAVLDPDAELPGIWTLLAGWSCTAILAVVALFLVVGVGGPVLAELRGWLRGRKA